MYNGIMSLYCEKNSMTIKSLKFSKILRPNIGLNDSGPLSAQAVWPRSTLFDAMIRFANLEYITVLNHIVKILG